MFERLKDTSKKFLLLGISGIAFGFLESIVVVYLRQIYYPQGFEFPLQILSPKMISIEILREMCTMLMLISISVIAGKNSLQKICFFIYSFGVWDIFYYAGLKLLLDWPNSFLEWDVLFLIPVVWIGPVLAPLIISITMILISWAFISSQEKGLMLKFKIYFWIFICIGIVLLFITFIWDYSKLIVDGGFLYDVLCLSENKEFLEIFSQYKPTSYNWLLFSVGEILIVFPVLIILWQSRKLSRK